MPGPAGMGSEYAEADPSPEMLSTQKLVLIADDEAPIVEMLAFVIREAGYTPIRARHGRQALELARATRPALVITDLMMPHFNGTKLIETLREDAAAGGYPAPPVVLITAAGQRAARAAGADAMVPKPFDLAEIEALLRRFLGPG